MVRHSFPFIVLLPFAISIWGLQIVYDLILSILNFAMFGVVISLVTDRTFPFTRKKSAMQTDVSTKMLPSIFTILMFIGLVLVHYFLLLPVKGLVLIAIPLTFLLLLPLFRLLKNTKWEKITLDI